MVQASTGFETLVSPYEVLPKAAVGMLLDFPNVWHPLEGIFDRYSMGKVFTHENVSLGPIYKRWSSMLILCPVMLLCRLSSCQGSLANGRSLRL
jgi:hypothetical protein